MKKFLIFLFIIFFIGGIYMSLFGFRKNKCKRDVSSDFAIVTGTSSASGSVSVDYPTGFNRNNCVVISAMVKGISTAADPWGYGSAFNSSNNLAGNCSISVSLSKGGIVVSISDIRITNESLPLQQGLALPFKIILMKLPTGDEANLPGDVNLDGEITNDDVTAVQQYLLGNNPLNFKQYANADVNKDGEVDAADVLLIQGMINGE